MKYMKLGSKPDAFQSDGRNIRFFVSELPADVFVHVDEVRFHLHKFPLLSKSRRLLGLMTQACDNNKDEIFLHDFPGGSKAFEVCAKFCYGMVVTLSAHNVAAARCAAEYLEMTEDVDKGNLIYKIEVFLNTSILQSWKDSIIALQTTKLLLPWSEELNLVERCIKCIASKTSTDPSNVSWSYTCNRKWTASDSLVEIEQGTHEIPPDWWIEDICELDVELYKRVMIAVKSKGRMSSKIIGEALKFYTFRWLPDSYDALVADDYMRKNRILVETIISLLPSDKCGGSLCRFLLKLLKVVILVGGNGPMKEELIDRISMQLHKASVKDLLVPAKSDGNTIYDVNLVQCLVSKSLMQVNTENDISFDKSDNAFVEIASRNKVLLALGRLVDGYLAEIAHDPNLYISSFIDIAKSVPEEARPSHDGLYTAIDIYLKDHPDLTKEEKKMICALMDVKKFSSEASIHAAQNEQLPLRIVVQVLFFEHLKISGVMPTTTDDISMCQATMDGDCEGRIVDHHNILKHQMENLSIKADEYQNGEGKKIVKTRSTRIFDKLWIDKGQRETGKKSETSRSSQSTPTFVKRGEDKTTGSSRNTKHSIS
ncbi:BTB/POZ domain-containing protein NPY1-like isoform X1 [Zingiber officinale]|uniref:NPH3 domain-containing protein n=2 Tax=Zingiber officinale TaxID=94328 RepID=A0A8J5GUB6_ZINOF|nr:BTB/POZ domain-containing protein NPY1-like isoform X1 [Zingiber officinale]KAG6511703.1 hypothetical protein ZIOFF_029780 [Zingiber officinale]